MQNTSAGMESAKVSTCKDTALFAAIRVHRARWPHQAANTLFGRVDMVKHGRAGCEIVQRMSCCSYLACEHLRCLDLDAQLNQRMWRRGRLASLIFIRSTLLLDCLPLIDFSPDGLKCAGNPVQSNLLKREPLLSMNMRRTVAARRRQGLEAVSNLRGQKGARGLCRQVGVWVTVLAKGIECHRPSSTNSDRNLRSSPSIGSSQASAGTRQSSTDKDSFSCTDGSPERQAKGLDHSQNLGKILSSCSSRHRTNKEVIRI